MEDLVLLTTDLPIEEEEEGLATIRSDSSSIVSKMDIIVYNDTM
jgi:hypothetical protein